MTQVTRKTTVVKPKKPHKDFPLFPHATKRWAKKIRGKTHYFGKWNDPDGALQKYLTEKDDLHSGRVPQKAKPGELTVADLCNRFLAAKRAKLDNGELSEKSYSDYFRTCRRLVGVFGKSRAVDSLAPDDFARLRAEMAKRLGVVALKNEIGRCRMPLKFAYDEGLIDKPIRYGQSFSKPSKKILRQHRQAQQAEYGERMFSADEVRRILEAADPALKAMVLLAINCGFGQSDVANLPQSAVDLESGWIDFPRPKTAVERHCPLWSETVDALRLAIDRRPTAKSDSDDVGICFLTKYGNRWVRMSDHEQPEQRTSLDAVSGQFSKLLKSLGINGKRGFYALRHTFETVGGESKDQVAVNSIMGHVDVSMASDYREGVSDGRLKLVVDAIHSWLFGAEDGAA